MVIREARDELWTGKVSWASMLPEDFRDYAADKLGFELTDQELITVLRCAPHSLRLRALFWAPEHIFRSFR